MYLPIPKTVILFALAGIVLYPFVPYISRVMVIAGIVLIFLPIWFLRDSMWVLAIGAGIIVIRFTYDLWWLFISRAADRALLRLYFTSELSLKQTAERCFLHVNTVQYRLRRVRERCGLDPRRFREAALLYVALRVEAMNRREEQRDPAAIMPDYG